MEKKDKKSAEKLPNQTNEDDAKLLDDDNQTDDENEQSDDDETIDYAGDDVDLGESDQEKGDTDEEPFKPRMPDQKLDMMMVQHLKIPLNRVGVLIGPGGKTKTIIEKETTTKIDVKSDDGTVTINTTSETEDPILAWKARDIVQAIGRGFSEKRALALLSDDWIFDMINLTGTLKNQNRLKGRVIGEKGYTRNTIEKCTSCFISVAGKTISMIGDTDDLTTCRRAIEMLIYDGSPHPQVYKMLEEYRLKRKTQGERLWRKAY